MQMTQTAQTTPNPQASQGNQTLKETMKPRTKKFYRSLWTFCKFAWLGIIVVIATGVAVSILTTTPDNFGSSILIRNIAPWFFSQTLGCRVAWCFIILLLALSVLSSWIVDKVGTSDSEANEAIQIAVGQLTKAVGDFQASTGPIAQLTAAIGELKRTMQQIGQIQTGNSATLSPTDLEKFIEDVHLTAEALKTTIETLAQKNGKAIDVVTNEQKKAIETLTREHEEATKTLIQSDQENQQIFQQVLQQLIQRMDGTLHSIQTAFQMSESHLKLLQEHMLEQGVLDHTHKGGVRFKCGHLNRTEAKFCQQCGQPP